MKQITKKEFEFYKTQKFTWFGFIKQTILEELVGWVIIGLILLSIGALGYLPKLQSDYHQAITKVSSK